MDQKYVGIGAATGTIGVWLMVGFVFGAAIGATIGRILAVDSNEE